ncbi:hypothetical protein HMPREF3216_00059 [Gardnerella vaginalis]|uniref:Uncharacterized protein n=1 Tax=Gardnerella vaginalis TaxID=2702 RepID=A0A133NT99_GARVA|nr:hypothetical protein HMPREF3216_00059 [Gardnerella vaginalis]
MFRSGLMLTILVNMRDCRSCKSPEKSRLYQTKKSRHAVL